MMRSLWLLLLTGCEKMDEPGPMFSAVEVETSSEAVVPEPDSEGSGSDFEFPEPQVISSDELNSGNIDGQDPVEGSDPVAVVEGGSEPTTIETTEPITVTLTSETPTTAEPEPAEPVAMASQVSVASMGTSNWPIRLVKTLPETNPPRAILGLPSGEELVVSPGSMVPEHGLVIISIGPNSAQVAQVTPQGDHASISPMTLQTMY
ncbi:MAG: hypothetical protein ACI8RZ_007823 [Myxococcota bacterium]|jgi:hypothetical protein